MRGNHLDTWSVHMARSRPWASVPTGHGRLLTVVLLGAGRPLSLSSFGFAVLACSGAGPVSLCAAACGQRLGCQRFESLEQERRKRTMWCFHSFPEQRQEKVCR